MKNTVSIKGTREGLTITLGSGELPTLLEDLTQHLVAQGAFFHGGTVALQIGDRALREDDLKRISTLLGGHEMVLRTVFTTNTTTQGAVRGLGLRLVEQEPAQEPSATVPVAQTVSATHTLDGSKGLLIHHLVRSGQVIRHTGHVAVIGDVNVGGEIVAGGDVVIWGRLFGTVHAGATGKQQAIVCALELSPVQLRIGDLVARPEEGDRVRRIYPEVAFIRDNSIVVEPWDRAPRGV